MQNKVYLPNFLIVGAARSGTTSLYNYLIQHPDIFMPKEKEPAFFAFAGEDIQFSYGENTIITRYSNYVSLFRGSEKYKVRGEASTPYLYFYKKSIRNIERYIPEKKIKIIIILRNPVKRAFSQYLLKRKFMMEKLPFMEAIREEKKRINSNYHFDFFYIDRGFYYNQVKSYLEKFEQVKVLLYDDLKENPRETMKVLFEFLGVDSDHIIDVSKRYNISGTPKSNILQKLIIKDFFLKRMAKMLVSGTLVNSMGKWMMQVNLGKEKMDHDAFNYLNELYAGDIRKLSELIGRDLSNWLECEK